jgi:hypothetical protein
LGIYEEQLRYFTPEGDLVPTPTEAANQEKQRNQQLAQKLRELGINPDEI